jgi:hypothetical protein
VCVSWTNKEFNITSVLFYGDTQRKVGIRRSNVIFRRHGRNTTVNSNLYQTTFSHRPSTVKLRHFGSTNNSEYSHYTYIIKQRVSRVSVFLRLIVGNVYQIKPNAITYEVYYTVRQTNAEVKKTGNVRINLTLRRVRITIVAAEKQYILHILSVCVCL